MKNEELIAALEAIQDKAWTSPLYGQCDCDGFSVGHEPDCRREIVGQHIALPDAEKYDLAQMLPDIIAALKAREVENDQ